MSQPTAYTLSQLQQEISYAVSTSPAGRGLWVTAELVDVRESGGHLYMELVEKNETGQTIAKMRANIWRNTLHYLQKKFYDATGSYIVTGLKVMVGGMAGNHPLYGLSFNIRDIDPSYTLGDMARLRREILERLKREGVLDWNKRREMPAVPQRIAVISSRGAAGYGDFQDQLTNNASGTVFYPHLFEAVLQGDNTSSSIRAALSRIEESIDFWDCVVIIRGGGATTDLAGFDEYELARAVATFPLPIVVGIGHERDRTVLDEIAHTRIKTPTGVAAFFVERAADWLNRAETLVNAITRYASEYVNGEMRRVAQLGAMLPALVTGRVQKGMSDLTRLGAIIPTIGKSRLERYQQRLNHITTILPMLASQRLKPEMMRLDTFSGQVKDRSLAVLGRMDERLAGVEQVISAYSPARTLSRGYSITRCDGKAVRRAEDIPSGVEIATELSDGTLYSVTR
ncbi:MAG: exodeoxyribonuclease VII large subunit [Prevotella sp.]|nr:exodeoxyribonuclease VII large subunit [Bacteroides sp.]MCM1365708.1 exodeoxyribonuclease VII large subunit [Prevotella sp.]MCM1436378.1 exodeoxyribonuclease VII large subunit [Prevotella sp.]